MLAHRRLLICLAAGAVAAIAVPGIHTVLTRALIGWNVLVWLYLAWVAVGIRQAEKGHLQKLAIAQGESAPVVLTVVVVASIVSLVAVLLEILAAKSAAPHEALWHVVLAAFTVVGSWLLLPTLFGLTYASQYYGAEPGLGLMFPGATAKFEPDHTDFLYFSFTIAVASQTADVAVTTREMRRLVVVQSVLSFVFNTTILAFSINAAAGMFS